MMTVRNADGVSIEVPTEVQAEGPDAVEAYVAEAFKNRGETFPAEYDNSDAPTADSEDGDVE